MIRTQHRTTVIQCMEYLVFGLKPMGLLVPLWNSRFGLRGAGKEWAGFYC